MRKDGLDFDLSLPQPTPEVDMEMVENVDIEHEKSKSKNCPFWPSEEEFINSFNLNHLEGEELEKVKILLLSFKHIFYNEKFPAQFRPGVAHIRPMKIMRRPGMVPKKERLPQISPKKLAYLEKHITELTQQGVQKKLRNVESYHASPVHVVIESRYVASKGINTKKS